MTQDETSLAVKDSYLPVCSICGEPATGFTRNVMRAVNNYGVLTYAPDGDPFLTCNEHALSTYRDVHPEEISELYK